MTTRRTTALALAAGSLAVLGATVPATTAHASDGDATIRTGSCSGRADWKIKAKPDDGRLEVEAEVDSNRAGQTWRWKLRRNGHLVADGSSRTAGRSGSFSIERRAGNAAGSDTFRLPGHPQRPDLRRARHRLSPLANVDPLSTRTSLGSASDTEPVAPRSDALPWRRLTAMRPALDRDDQVRPHRVYGQVLLLTVLVLVGVAVVGAYAAQREAEDEAVAAASRRAELLADVVIEPLSPTASSTAMVRRTRASMRWSVGMCSATTSSASSCGPRRARSSTPTSPG